MRRPRWPLNLNKELVDFVSEEAIIFLVERKAVN
jgi:hypothetical protein